MDTGDAATIINQHITDTLAAMSGSADSTYTLHSIVPPDLAFTLCTASSDLYRAGAWRRVSAAIVHKEQALLPELLKSVTSEQLAAVDVLVLARSQRFLGHSMSSMSWLVQELRVLAGKPRGSSMMPGAWPNNTRLHKQTYAIKDP
ncbi:g6716 [Coccomyxa viridis]|uniref:G6716 protein n=1 Tax=Coccomyxa viridis TaxID=1274662 RepID=A0ABP1FW17_9CHLO